MFKQAIQKARGVTYVKVKETGKLTKRHSNLHIYEEDGTSVEFVANFGSPAVGGYIVCIDNDAPCYYTQHEFHRSYMESQDA